MSAELRAAVRPWFVLLFAVPSSTLGPACAITARGTPEADLTEVAPPPEPTVEVGVNRPPHAVAGPDVDTRVNRAVRLDGGASTDPDGDALRYTWFLVHPDRITRPRLLGRSRDATFVPDVIGTYRVRLVVDDGRGGRARDELYVRAAPANRRPVARATGDRSVVPGTLLLLDGTTSHDPDGDTLTYRWQLARRPARSKAALLQTTTATPWLLADVAGVYEVTLVVDDGELHSAPDAVRVVAREPVNIAPVVDAGPDACVSVGERVVLDATASIDEDDEVLGYEWELTRRPAGSRAVLLDDATARPEFVADVDGVFDVTLVVSDGVTRSAPDGVQVLVNATGESATWTPGFRAVDAAYSDALGLVVILPEGAAEVALLDPHTRAREQVTIARPGTAVAVTPDGGTAVVGHEDGVTVVDLAGRRVGRHYADPGAVATVVASAEHAYVVAAGAAGAPLRTVHLATGTVTSDAAGPPLTASARLALAPDGTRLYATDAGGAGGLMYFDLSDGTARYAGESSAPIGEPSCGGAWATPPGHVLTGCGRVFRGARGEDDDLTVFADLPDVLEVRHAGRGAREGEIAVLAVTRAARRGELRALDAKDLSPSQVQRVEGLVTECRVHAPSPRFVFGSGAFTVILSDVDVEAGRTSIVRVVR